MTYIKRAGAATGSKLTKKSKLRVQCAVKVTLTGGYWDGGSRTTWYTIKPGTDGSSRAALSYPTAPPQFGGSDAPTVSISPGTIVVRDGVFCGENVTPTLHVHPYDLPAVLGVEWPLPPLEECTDMHYAVMFDAMEEKGFDVRPHWFRGWQELPLGASALDS